MKLSFTTNVYGDWQWPVGKLARWAKDNGFQGIEVGPLTKTTEEEMRQAMEETGTEIPALIYCRNVLDVNKDVAAFHRKQVLDRVRWAGNLGIPLMVTSTGRAQNLTIEQSLEPGLEFLGKEVLPLAKDCGVKVALENCPAIGNVACSPAMWRKTFAALPDLGLAYDPSHLVWQFIDPYIPMREFGDRIVHVHAKDTEILPDVLQDVGIEGQGWWRYRMPGWGAINWTRIVSQLMEIGYDGYISIEHEDPVWHGTEEKVAHALNLGRKLLTATWS